MLPEKRAKKKYNDRWNKLEAGHRKLLTATTIEPEESSFEATSAALPSLRKALERVKREPPPIFHKLDRKQIIAVWR